MKAFLPAELTKSLAGKIPKEEMHVIKWTPEMLITMVNQRLSVHSNGKVHDFSEISTSSTSTTVTTYDFVTAVNKAVGILSPREIVYVGEKVFFTHLNSEGPQGKITRDDLTKAIEEYAKDLQRWRNAAIDKNR